PPSASEAFSRLADFRRDREASGATEDRGKKGLQQSQRQRHHRARGIILLLFCCLALLDTKANASDPASEIVLGMSAGLTGYTAKLGKDVKMGITAAL